MTALLQRKAGRWRIAGRAVRGVSEEQALPGSALMWLMSGFIVLLLPQWNLLPWWMILACLALALWRWLAQLGRLRLPGRWLRLSVMAVLILAYGVSVRGQFTVDSAASFFVLAVGLKWLETRSSRDFFVLFFILTYLAAVNFLFQQGIGWTLLNLLGVVILLVALQLLHSPGSPRRVTGQALQRLGLMALKTLPVVVLLFVFFPRMAPLWSVPLVSQQARTGITDTMTPGDISSLVQNRERAFRVSFGDDIPAHRDRYWRGLILDRFDGETWRQWQPDPPLRPARINLDSGAQVLGAGQYEVLLEASGQRWVYALEQSRALSVNLRPVQGGLYRLQRPADTAVGYRMELTAEAALSQTDALTEESRRRYLQVPAGTNPRARELARGLQEAHDSPLERVRVLMERFHTGNYYYTLQPPAMPEDPVDALLFDEQRGFCAHYASATAFVLRVAGIPARVVVGYQGGAVGAGEDYLIVRQYDAHAWVEAWIEGRGWVRVDPTAAISPLRIESGLQDAMAADEGFTEQGWTSPDRYHNIPAIRWMSLQMDRINYNWQRWVVGYQGQSQTDLLSRLPGDIGLRELGYLSAGVVGLALLVSGLWLALTQSGRARRDPVSRLLERWRRLLLRAGAEIPAGATPTRLAELTADVCPGAARAATAFAGRVNSHYYGPADPVGSRGAGEAGLRRQFLVLKRTMRECHPASRRFSLHRFGKQHWTN